MSMPSFCMKQDIKGGQLKISKNSRSKSSRILRRTEATHKRFEIPKRFEISKELLPDIPDLSESSIVTFFEEEKCPITHERLCQAIEYNDLKSVKKILKNQSINIEHTSIKEISFGNSTFEERLTPLGLASYLCLPNMVQTLIDKNANINVQGFFNPLNLVMCAKPPIRFDMFDTSFLVCRNQEKYDLGRVFHPFTQEEKIEESLFRQRQRECLKLLVENRADIHKNYYGGGTALHRAAHVCAHLIPDLIDYGIKVNETKPLNNKNALLELLDHCYNHPITDVIEAAQALLDARGDVYQETNLGLFDDTIAKKRWDGESVYTWMQHQVRSDVDVHPKLMEIILSAIDQQTKDRLPVHILKQIFIIIGKRNPQILATFACVNKNWNEAINSAEVTKKVFPTVHRIPLYTFGAKVYHWVNANLCEAILHQDIKTMNLLLQDSRNYVNPNYMYIKKTDVGPLNYKMHTTPMVLVGQQCNIKMMNALIRAGGNINAPAPYNALMAVVEAHSDKSGFKETQQKCVQLLLDNKADIHKKNKNGTVLHHAAQYGKAHLMPMLVSEENVNIQDSNGSTALCKLFEHWNTYNPSVFTTAVKALLEAKADIAISNKEGKSVDYYVQKIKKGFRFTRGFDPAIHMIKELSGKKINESL
jgi:ankyrin repeat protein